MNKIKRLSLLLLPFIALMLSVDEASATALVDTVAVDAAFVDLTDTVEYFEGKTWPIVFLVTGIGLGIGFFKKFTRMGAR